MRGYVGHYGQSMRVVSGVVRQEFRRLVDSHVINSALHWAKEMVVKVWDVNGLVNPDVIRERDQVVMELIFGKVVDKKTIRSLSRCRGSLEIIFLSDMTTADGRYLEQFVFNPGSKVARSKYKFP